MTLRIGLFGAGWAARAAHGPSLAAYRRRRGGIVLAAVCDLDAARAEEVRVQFGFMQAYSSVAEALSGGRLDAAVVAVSSPHNADVALACVRVGLPVLLEKPPALTGRQARSLDRTIRRLKGRVSVAFNRRWNPALVRLRELLSVAGPVQTLRADLRRVARSDADFSTTAVHAVDTLRFLAGADFRSLDVIYGRCGPKAEATSFHGLGEMAGGAAVAFDIVPMAGRDQEDYTVTVGGRTFVAAQHDTGGFYQETAAFLDALRRHAPLPGPTVAETVQSVEIMELLGRRGRRYRRRRT